MKILVTGANGQVGRELVEQCLEQGYGVVVANRNQLDISNEQSVAEFCHYHQPHAIINAAAYTAVDLAESETERAFAVNALGAKYLAQTALTLNIPMLHFSTDYVFDGTKNSPYCEQDGPNPINAYGSTKLQGEIYLKQSGANYLVLRTSWVFSQHGNNFVKTMVRLASERDKLRVIDDQLGCPTSAADLAKAALTVLPVLIDKKTMATTYHYAGNPAVSWFDFASAIIDIAHSKKILDRKPTLEPIKSSQYPVTAIRPKNSRLSSVRFSSEFGLAESDWQSQLEQIIT